MTELRRQNSLDKAVAALAALTEDDLDPLNGAVVERRVLLVNQYLTCKVCKGYFREAHTFKGCNHTFCKWCLMREFDRGVRTCPFPGESSESGLFAFKQCARRCPTLSRVAQYIV